MLLPYTYPKPKLSPHRKLCISTFPPNTHSVWFISVWKVGTWHEERRFQRERFVGRAWFILAASARAWRCAQRTKCNGGFGFQTKVKDRFLNQRRWTCWYSCRKKHASPVSDSQFSFTFCFRFEKLIVIFAVYLASRYGGFPYFFILLLFDSSVFAKHSVIYYSIQHVMCPICHASSYSFC